MNNRIFISSTIVFLFLLVLSAFYQVGIKAGIGVSDIVFLKYGHTPYLGYEINSLEHRIPMMAFQGGAFGTIRLRKRIDFQPELLFTRQGLNYSSEYLYDDITYKINISYLKIPFLLKYNISIKKKMNSSLFIGPYTAWKLNAVRVTEVEGEREKVKVSNIKNTDFGVRNPHFPDQKITPYMLLTHSSGLAWPEDKDGIPDFYHFYTGEQSPLISEWLPYYILPGGSRYRASVWKDFPPGEKWLYSNGNGQLSF